MREFSELEYASEELKADRESIMEADVRQACAFECASEELKAEYTSEDLKADENMEAAMHMGNMFEYTSEELKASEKSVVEAGIHNGVELEYASEELKADKKLMEVDMHIGNVFEYASDELEADSGVYTSALRRSWCRRRRPSSSSIVSVDMLQYRRKTTKFSGEHRAVWLDILVFLAAVWWRAPHFELEADTTLVEETTKPNGGMQECLSEELKDEELMTEDVNLKGRPREPDSWGVSLGV